MKITIEYCKVWNYEPRAAGLAADISQKFGVAPELIASSGGVFEVVVNGDLIFSKQAEDRFPEDDEVMTGIAARV